jgi:hypothetical protein
MDNDLIDMIAAEEPSATDVHDKIKDILYAKSAENIDTIKPAVTASMFGGPNPYLDVPEDEVETEPSAEVEEPDEAPGTPSSVEDSAEIEEPTDEVDAIDYETEEEKPEA